jgi:uncharacterized protein (DUF58 family)
MAVATRQLGPVTRIGAATVVLGVVCYVVGWRLGWIELMVATAGCLVALAVAVPFIVGRVALELTRTVEPDRVVVGEPAGAVLSVVNPGRMRTRAIGIDEVIGGTVVPIAVPGLAPGGDHSAVYRLPTDRRAKVQVGPAEVARSDPLGLLRRKVSQAPATTLWVHPRWAITAPLPTGFAKDLEGPTSDASPAGDVAFHALRPYRLGDDRRHIHWMSTARTGSLMVRHYVDNRRPTLGVLLDDAMESYDDEMFEVAVEITASLLVSSLLHQLPVTGRTTSEWLAGRLRPVGRDSLLEHLTVVERTEHPAGLVEASAELTRVETSTSALAIVTGGRSAIELLAPVAYLRKRVRVIVVVVDGAVAPEQRVDALPGARVLHAADLDGFRAAWKRMVS